MQFCETCQRLTDVRGAQGEYTAAWLQHDDRCDKNLFITCIENLYFPYHVVRGILEVPGQSQDACEAHACARGSISPMSAAAPIGGTPAHRRLSTAMRQALPPRGHRCSGRTDGQSAAKGSMSGTNTATHPQPRAGRLPARFFRFSSDQRSPASSTRRRNAASSQISSFASG